jgi:hypothetical protein
LINYTNNPNERTAENVNQVLILCHRLVSHKNGSCIHNLTEIFEWVIEYLDHKPQLTQVHLHTLSSIVSTLCLSNIGLPSYQANTLIDKVSKKHLSTLYVYICNL